MMAAVVLGPKPPSGFRQFYPVWASCHGFEVMSEGYAIRPMGLADLERVVAVERLCYAHPWSRDLFLRELDNPLSTVDLLWLGEELAGYLCSWLVSGELHILNVATAPAFRRHGVAATLLRHVLDRSLQKGLERAFLEVRVSNAGAIALYRAFGFRVVARRQRYYVDGEDALVMEYSVTSDE